MTTHADAVEDIKKAKDAVDDIERPKNVSLGQLQKTVNIPDPEKHKYISFAKSFVRIVAGVCLIVGFPVWCGVGLVAAEVLGIAEELV